MINVLQLNMQRSKTVDNLLYQIAVERGAHIGPFDTNTIVDVMLLLLKAKKADLDRP